MLKLDNKTVTDYLEYLREGRLVESKYLGTEESVMRKLGKLIWQDVHEQEIVRRVVVTDGVSGVVERGGKSLELVSLSEWLR